MSLKRFQMDVRFWLWISGTLFTACWVVPSILNDDHQPLIYFAYLDHVDCRYGIVMLILWFGIPSVIIGWVIHCIVVLIRDRHKHQTNTA